MLSAQGNKEEMCGYLMNIPAVYAVMAFLKAKCPIKSYFAQIAAVVWSLKNLHTMSFLTTMKHLFIQQITENIKTGEFNI